MNKEKQIEELTVELIKTNGYGTLNAVAEHLYDAGYRKQSENEALEAVDMFRNLIMNKFIELCNYNDFGKINLLLIGETIDRTFDNVVAKMKGGE